jgi:hypothetical protein
MYLPLADTACDTSLYEGVSVLVKNAGDQPLVLLLKIEGGGGWHQQAFTLPAQSGWTELFLSIPWDGIRVFSWQAGGVLIFPQPNQIIGDGAFVIYNVKLRARP